jgi:DNA-binding MarR family transcriptional regulator
MAAASNKRSPNGPTLDADATPSGLNPEPTLRHVVGRIDRALRTQLNQRLDDHGLTTPGYTTMFVLRRLPGLSNAELARRTGVTPQATNLIVIALAERGLIERQTSAEHNRILNNRLTPEGLELIELCEAQAEEIEALMLDGFSDQERARFRAFLRRSAVNLGQEF